MKIGILEILTFPASSLSESCYGALVSRQYSSIMPQTVSYWCRSLGHEVYYNTYWGVGNILKKLPKDLDFVFVSCPTHLSHLAYIVGKFYKNRAITVLGGPHAKCYPEDSLRFFDLVVKRCDKTTIQSILNKEYAKGTTIDTEFAKLEFPSVEQRFPEIKKSFILDRSFLSVVPYLTSVGCPNRCPFCVDWNSEYSPLSIDLIREDFYFLSKTIPSAIIGFHDPNFGTNIDEVLDLMISINFQNPYVMECSLDSLTSTVVKKLKKTNCVLIAPGIESWTAYSQKSGCDKCDPMEKLEHIVGVLENLKEVTNYIQSNFIFGLDTDEGDTPLRLTRELCSRVPSIWPNVNLPMAFAGTPLHKQLMKQDRLLPMPFSFCVNPYLTIVPKNYDIEDFYLRFTNFIAFVTNRASLSKRIQGRALLEKIVHVFRSGAMKLDLVQMNRILKEIRKDKGFRRFHSGESKILPQYYLRKTQEFFGQLYSMFSPEEQHWLLNPLTFVDQ
ncbi:MAG: radical SAM protein [Proteobacteria bacterium]|jgi:hypothetical protein|nr:radical SAM protein [Pseudomonadota bacterium]